MERIPILKMGEYLLVTIQVDMHDRLAMTLQDDLTTKIVSASAKGVLIDISALEMVDSFIGRMLGDIAAMSRVLDAETVVVGHASGRRDHARGARPLAARRPNSTERRARDGAAANPNQGATTGWRSCLTNSEPSNPQKTSSASARLFASARWSSGSTSSIRRKLSPPPASSPATPFNTAAAAVLIIEGVEEGGRRGLRLTFEDQGPGIPDVELALRDGYTTGGGLGLGLGGARRLANEFYIQSRPGEGTRVTVVRWR